MKRWRSGFSPMPIPSGRHIKPGPRESKSPWLTIVGVVGNIKTDGFDQPDQPHLYLPILQNPGYAMAVYVRTEGNPGGLTQALRQQVQAVDPNLPLFGEQTMEDLVSASLAQRRFAMQVVGTVWRARALPGRYRYLRSDGVFSDATDARNWNSPRARRQHRSHSSLAVATRDAA